MTVGRPEGRSADRHGAAIVFDSDLPPRSRRGLGKVLSGALYIAKRTPVAWKGLRHLIRMTRSLLLLASYTQRDHQDPQRGCAGR